MDQREFDHEQYQYEQLLKLGNDAAQLLGNPVYQYAYSAMLDDMQRRFFTTEPGKVKTLEEIRREGNALGAMQKRFNFFVAQARAEADKQAQYAANGEDMLAGQRSMMGGVPNA